MRGLEELNPLPEGLCSELVAKCIKELRRQLTQPISSDFALSRLLSGSGRYAAPDGFRKEVEKLCVDCDEFNIKKDALELLRKKHVMFTEMFEKNTGQLHFQIAYRIIEQTIINALHNRTVHLPELPADIYPLIMQNLTLYEADQLPVTCNKLAARFRAHPEFKTVAKFGGRDYSATPMLYRSSSLSLISIFKLNRGLFVSLRDHEDRPGILDFTSTRSLDAAIEQGDLSKINESSDYKLRSLLEISGVEGNDGELRSFNPTYHPNFAKTSDGHLAVASAAIRVFKVERDPKSKKVTGIQLEKCMGLFHPKGYLAHADVFHDLPGDSVAVTFKDRSRPKNLKLHIWNLKEERKTHTIQINHSISKIYNLDEQSIIVVGKQTISLWNWIKGEELSWVNISALRFAANHLIVSSCFTLEQSLLLILRTPYVSPWSRAHDPYKIFVLNVVNGEFHQYTKKLDRLIEIDTQLKAKYISKIMPLPGKKVLLSTGSKKLYIYDWDNEKLVTEINIKNNASKMVPLPTNCTKGNFLVGSGNIFSLIKFPPIKPEKHEEKPAPLIAPGVATSL